MKLQILSDLHLEFGLMEMVPKGEILILAGDIGVVKKPSYLRLVNAWAEDFDRVYYVAGNHEFYKGDIDVSLDKLCEGITANNIHILENDWSYVEDVVFIGATLWTNLSNPMASWNANDRMNDFHLIRKNNYAHKFFAQDSYDKFIYSSHYIFNSAKKISIPANKIVVITHHAPSFMSVPDRFKGELLNDAFASNLNQEIENSDINLWIHGHTHDSFDYKIGDTRVICNPRGYVGHGLNANFNPTLVIDI